MSRAQSIPHWQNFFLIYNIQVGSIAIILFITVVTILYLWMTLEQRQYDIWRCSLVTLQSSLGFTSPLSPKTTILRLVHQAYMLAYVAGVTIIIAYFITFMTTVFTYTQISHVQQIIDANFRLMGNPNILGHLMSQNLVRHDMKQYLELFQSDDDYS